MKLLRRAWQVIEVLLFTLSLVVFLMVLGAYYVLVVLAHDGRTPFNTSETRMIGVERYKADAP